MTPVFFINAFRNISETTILKTFAIIPKKHLCWSLFYQMMIFCEYFEIFKGTYFGEHLETDGLLCSPISYQNVLCYFWKDSNFSMLKSPTMNLGKMLKISCQKRSYFISFCSAFLTSFLLWNTFVYKRHKKAELKQLLKNR